MTRNALSHMCHEYHDVWHVTGMSHSCHVSHNEDFNTRPCREKTQSDVGEIIFKSSTGVSYSLNCLKPHDYYYYENLRWQRIAIVGEAARKINLSPGREADQTGNGNISRSCIRTNIPQIPGRFPLPLIGREWSCDLDPGLWLVRYPATSPIPPRHLHFK